MPSVALRRCLLLALLLSACDFGAPRDETPDGPHVVESSPREGAQDVALDAPFVVYFDRRVLPRSVSRATVRVVSGNVSLFLSLRYDILEQRAVATEFDGRLLVPDVDYRLIVDGVEDLDGTAMREPVTIRFHTGTTTSGEVIARPLATWADASSIFTSACATPACHDSSFQASGLDLSSANGVATTAIGAVARTLPSGTVGAEGASGGPFFNGLRIVDVLGGVGRAETSYLVYTVLGDRHIYGSPMPPDAPLSEEEVGILVAWINAGAPTE